MLVAETKERGLASWIDGTASWLVAMNWNTGATVNYAGGKWNSTGATTPVVMAAAGQQGVGINFPAVQGASGAKFISNTLYSLYSAPGMAYGASSDHSGGIVLHTFGDGHVSQITSDIDPTVYVSLFSRFQGEPVNLE